MFQRDRSVGGSCLPLCSDIGWGGWWRFSMTSWKQKNMAWVIQCRERILLGEVHYLSLCIAESWIHSGTYHFSSEHHSIGKDQWIKSLPIRRQLPAISPPLGFISAWDACSDVFLGFALRGWRNAEDTFPLGHWLYSAETLDIWKATASPMLYKTFLDTPGGCW